MITDKEYSKNITIRNNLFDNFSERYFKYSPNIQGWSNLSNYCKLYDSVVVGSDQLWRPVNIEGDFYTLNFVPEEINKISYSTSFGVATLPKKQANKAKLFLKRIEFLSVREESGQKLIKRLINLDIPIVCDPTMLLTQNEWNSMIDQERVIEDDYILCYFLGSNEQYLNFSKKLKEKLDIKLVGLVHCAGYNDKVDLYFDEMPFSVGPLEFINLIKYAKYVLTDSFHCCVFSIIFEKNFYAFKRFLDNDEMSTNDRLVTLFRRTGIAGRLLTGHEKIDSSFLINIDYSNVSARLEVQRNNSLEYLRNALRKTKNG
jgi:hypothetical protein